MLAAAFQETSASSWLRELSLLETQPSFGASKLHLSSWTLTKQYQWYSQIMWSSQYYARWSFIIKCCHARVLWYFQFSWKTEDHWGLFEHCKNKNTYAVWAIWLQSRNSRPMTLEWSTSLSPDHQQRKEFIFGFNKNFFGWMLKRPLLGRDLHD